MSDNLVSLRGGSTKKVAFSNETRANVNEDYDHTKYKTKKTSESEPEDAEV